MVKSVKEVFFEEVSVAIVRREHGIEVVRNAFPERGYRPRVAWVHCLGCVVEAIVKRTFEEVSYTVGVSETGMKAFTVRVLTKVVNIPHCKVEMESESCIRKRYKQAKRERPESVSVLCIGINEVFSRIKIFSLFTIFRYHASVTSYFALAKG